VQAASARTQARIDSGAQVIVGLNRYRPETDEQIKVLKIDNSAVRQAQFRRLEQLKSQRDASRVEVALNALNGCARSGQGNLLELSIQAARAQATVGEMSLALEKVFGRYQTEERLVPGVYLAELGAQDPRVCEVRERLGQFEQRNGRKPRLFICKLGQDGHDRGQEVVGAALHDLGFDVVLGPLFQTPEEAARAAIAIKADLVGMSSLAAGHLTLMPALQKALTAQGRAELPIVVGGVIPPQDYAELLSHGVRAIFSPGTVLPAAAVELLNILRT
jgi:methylmalonyl-CoA mutase